MDKDEDITNSQYVSPCIRNCCLNTDDICVGCYRTIDEILRWNASDDDERKEVLLKCVQRRSSNGRL